jgi:tetratricopeptide (TPR) repeat protein
MNKKYVVILSALCLNLVNPGAQTLEGYGTPGDYLLELAGDAREFGRGGGSTALVDNTASIYQNPAGLGRVTDMEFSFGYTRLMKDFNFYNGAFAYSFGKFGVVGLDLTGYVSPEVPAIDKYGITRHTFRGSENAMILSYGKEFLKRFGVGVNVKVATSTLDVYTGLGVGADIGLTAKVFDWLQFGVCVANLGGPTLTLDALPDQYSTTLKVGLGSKLLENRLSISADVQVQELIPDANAYPEGVSIQRPIRYAVGAEYYIIPYFGLRAGLNDRMITAGPGFRIGQIEADYAILFHRADKDFRSAPTHAFSFRYLFGKPVPQKELELNQQLRENEQKRQLRVAQRLYIDGYFAKADDTLKSYINAYPKDPEGIKLRDELNNKLRTQKTAAFLAEARDAYAKRNYARVNELLKELSIVAPNNPDADTLNQKMVLINKNTERIALVKTLFAQNKIPEMAKELEVVLSIDSSNVEALEYRAKIDKQVRKIEAETHYTMATRYYYDDKDVEKAHTELQQALALVPDYKEANELYTKISGEVKQLYLQKVGRMVDNNKLSVDNKDLAKLVQIDAQDRLVQAQKLLGAGQFDEAQAEVDAVLKSDAANVQALDLKKKIDKGLAGRKAATNYNEALQFFNQGKLKEAEVQAQTAIELAPDESKYQQLVTDIRKKQRESDLVTARQKMATGKEDDMQAAQTLIEGYLQADTENPEAKKLLTEVKVALLVKTADVLIDKGEYEQANQTLQNALKLDPDNGKVKNAFKNLKEAMDLLSD